MGFNVSCTHNRLVLNVNEMFDGNVNDKTKYWGDLFQKAVREDPMYKEYEYSLEDKDGTSRIFQGLWTISDGGYHRLRQSLAGEADSLDDHFSMWSE